RRRGRLRPGPGRPRGRLPHRRGRLPKLEPRLEDDSWWVRRAAASLASLGEIGVATVRRAVEAHPDKAAREMAVQILLESDELTPAAARLATGVA
ncbi:MAG TPA: hypothetical protein VGW74_06300, partial [Propionibacteriaceae bacterium]|nr:hypothetical protein [Propionibacteriaceae bacterium]